MPNLAAHLWKPGLQKKKKQLLKIKKHTQVYTKTDLKYPLLVEHNTNGWGIAIPLLDLCSVSHDFRGNGTSFGRKTLRAKAHGLEADATIPPSVWQSEPYRTSKSWCNSDLTESWEWGFQDRWENFMSHSAGLSCFSVTRKPEANGSLPKRIWSSNFKSDLTDGQRSARSALRLDECQELRRGTTLSSEMKLTEDSVPCGQAFPDVTFWHPKLSGKPHHWDLAYRYNCQWQWVLTVLVNALRPAPRLPCWLIDWTKINLNCLLISCPQMTAFNGSHTLRDL